MSNESKTNVLGSKPIGKLMLSMSLPAIISMIVQALYNIFDTMFVGVFVEGDNGINALSIIFPIQMLQLAFALGISIGANSLIARKLGEHKYEEAKNTHKTAIILSCISSAFFMILSSFLPGLFMNIFTKNALIYTMGKNYLTIIMLFSLPMFLEQTNAKALQASGNMRIPMICQLVGAVVNIILDPIFIKVLNLGVDGAAYATVIAQAVAFAVSFIYILKNKSIYNFHFKKFKMDKTIIIGVLLVAIPTTIMNAISSVTTFSLNFILENILQVSAAVTVLGLYFKLQSFIFMPIFGLGQGTIPIMGYNYSANNKERFKHTFRNACFVSFFIMLFGLLLFQVCPEFLLKIFGCSDDVIDLGVIALRIISIHFIPAAFGIVISSMFQAVGHGFKSMLMSILRQIVFILPSALLLGKFFGINNLWFAYAIAETLTLIIFIPIAMKTVRKIFKNHPLKNVNYNKDSI